MELVDESLFLISVLLLDLYFSDVEILVSILGQWGIITVNTGLYALNSFWSSICESSRSNTCVKILSGLRCGKF